MANIHAIANAFWPVLDEQETADVVFNHVSFFRSQPTGTAASTPVAERHYKGKLDHAQAVATNPHTDPELLRRFAKDTRVSVRQALLNNAATPNDVVCDLIVWSVGRGDWLPAEPFERLTLPEITSALRAAAVEHPDQITGTNMDFDALAERCTVETGHAVNLARTGVRGLTVALARRAHAGRIPATSLTDVAHADTESVEAILAALLGDRHNLSMELVRLWTTWRQDPENRMYRRFGLSFDRWATTEPGAANLLLDGDVGQLVTAIVNGADDELIVNVVGDADAEALPLIVEALRHRGVSARCEETIASRMNVLRSHGTLPRIRGKDVLAHFRHPLPDDVLVETLRTGDLELALWWFANVEHPCGARPGITREFFENPGTSLGRRTGDRDWTHLEQVRSVAVLAVTTRGDLFDDVLAAHDRWLGENLHQPTVAAVVYPFVKRSFAGPQQRAAWETFLSLAADWADDLTRLVDVVQELNGLDRTGEADKSPGDVPDASNLQLTLL